MRKHIIWSFDLEFIQDALDTSFSYMELFEKLNIKCSKTVIKMLQYRIKKDGIDKTKFTQNIKRNRFPNEKKLEEVLVENSVYFNSANLKTKLLKYNLLKYECQICGIKDWNGIDLSLQLDHINGISNDNRIENLRLLCPNCHSQTDTYAGKKKKELPIQTNTYDNKKKKQLPVREKYKFCQMCKTPVDNKIFCNSCDSKIKLKRRKVDRPEKDDLRQLIDKIGYSATGRKFGVSDNAIRKWLK